MSSTTRATSSCRSTRGIWACGSPACSAIPTRPTTSTAAGIMSSPRAATTCRATRSRSACPRSRRSSSTPLFWLEVGDEVTTHYTYDGAKLVPPEAPALEEVRGLAIERVEHRAELELQAALGAKLP